MTGKPDAMSDGRPLSFAGGGVVACKSEQSLLSPDDSLVAHEDLAAMAMMCPQPPATAPNVTTVVLPTDCGAASSLHPSQLPQPAFDDGHPVVYHVTTEPKVDSQVIIVIIIIIITPAALCWWA